MKNPDLFELLQGCDGDCDRHEEMPEEMKEFFDKMFGGLN